MTNRKVGIYIRKAVNYNDDDVETLKKQLYNDCEKEGWEIFDTYIDIGYSGGNMDRPGLQRLLKDITKFNTLFVHDPSMLSRNASDMLYIYKVLKENDVILLSKRHGHIIEINYDDIESEIGIANSIKEEMKETISKELEKTTE